MEKLVFWGEKVIHFLHLASLLKRDKKTEEDIEILYAREDREAIFWKLWQERAGFFLFAFVCVLCLILLTFFVKEESVLREGYFLSRDREKVTLAVTMNREGVQTSKEMTLSVGERELTDTELSELAVYAEKELKRSLPGKNASLLTVNQKLNFLTKLTGYPVTISWVWDDTYLKEDGSIRYGKVPKDGVDTTVTAIVALKDWEKEYHFQIHLVPRELTTEQAMIRTVRKKIRQEIRTQKKKEMIQLPKLAEDIQIKYELPEESVPGQVWLLLLLPCLLPLYWHEQMAKKKEKRSLQLMIDYSEMINKFTLLLGAGLTVRHSIERMVQDYEQKRDREGSYRYLYEELALVCNEIHNGMSERKALEHFGSRCQLLPYLRFSTLITQNMKKGTAGLLKLLETEAVDSLEQRRETVKRLGEEASTKLLLPMGIMLVLVIGIIMVPALFTM